MPKPTKCTTGLSALLRTSKTLKILPCQNTSEKSTEVMRVPYNGARITPRLAFWSLWSTRESRISPEELPREAAPLLPFSDKLLELYEARAMVVSTNSKHVNLVKSQSRISDVIDISKNDPSKTQMEKTIAFRPPVLGWRMGSVPGVYPPLWNDEMFKKTPQNWIGMLFWQLHRCARIISLHHISSMRDQPSSREDKFYFIAVSGVRRNRRKYYCL